jgi:predicted GIY-YIG superfamily endonuclease
MRRRAFLNFHTYILLCADGSYYVGHTSDLRSRVAAHNEGKAAQHTATRCPVELVYNEEHPSELDAIERERQIKKWSRAKKRALVAGDIGTLRSLSRSSDRRSTTCASSN